MVQIKIYYNIPDGSFDAVRRSIAQHLTPKSEDDANLSLAGSCDLPRIREGILAPVKDGLLVVKSVFDWDSAAYMAQDLGLFSKSPETFPKNMESNEELRRQLQRERYALPVTPGESHAYRLDIYKLIYNQARNPDERPFIFDLQGASGGDGIGLAMLSRQKDLLIREGQAAAAKNLEECTAEMQEVAPEHVQRELNSIPPSLEEVEQQIAELMQRSQTRGFISTIRALCYFEDFIGRGIRAAGYDAVTVELPSVGKGIYIGPDEMKQVTAFPHHSDAEIVQNVFIPAMARGQNGSN